MAISIDEFVSRVAASGLLAREEVEALAREQATRRLPPDADVLAKMLVSADRLTPYQASKLTQASAGHVRVGPYVLLEKLGAGGMGEVVKARHGSTGQLVAVKLIPNRIDLDEELEQRFRREVRLFEKVVHPNIVAALDSGVDDDCHYLAMEFVDGHDLHGLVRKFGPLEWPDAASLILQAARGIAYAHDLEIIHRDIKPSNLVLGKDGVLKILDFGLARQTTSQSVVLTQAGSMMGTVDYMAPEQAFDTRAADSRSDIYSLGCTLFFLLTGNPPYSGPSPLKRALAHKDSPVPSLSAQARVPQALDDLFKQMLAKEPEDRIQPMAEVANRLKQIGAVVEQTRDFYQRHSRSVGEQGVLTTPPPGVRSTIDSPVRDNLNQDNKQKQAAKPPQVNMRLTPLPVVAERAQPQPPPTGEESSQDRLPRPRFSRLHSIPVRLANQATFKKRKKKKDNSETTWLLIAIFLFAGLFAAGIAYAVFW